ncbi:MAG: NUDIX domain-containing protein [Micrococcales bacterium]|nr:NUDIX domain-containing protein [Micrococcales bacterium]MCL2666221.1 NUDIX domain-containing protein [Micrococcales bacterium]
MTRAAKAPEPTVVAAGALVWRVRGGELQVALVHRPRYKDWSWPKGKAEPGETLVGTAVREVAEETGMEVVLGRPLPGLRYNVGGRSKQVHYWAAQVGGRGDVALTARLATPHVRGVEIDDVRWFDAAAATRRLSRASDRQPLVALVRAHHDGLLGTRALAVVRHARARKRASWDGVEADRPLTRSGQAQTPGVVDLLSAFGVAAVTTSPWKRCRQTVAPYARATGLTLDMVDALTEDAHAASPARAAAQVEKLLTASTDTALCTHRPVMPTVLDVLATHSPRAVADILPSADPFLKPGHILVVHVVDTSVGPRLVAAQTLSPCG